MLRENWPQFSITVSKYFLPLQSNFPVRLKTVLHIISQNLKAIDRPVPEIKHYNDRHIAFSQKIYVNMIEKLHAVTQEKVEHFFHGF